MSDSHPEQRGIERPRKFALEALSREQLIERCRRAEASEATLQQIATSAVREIDRLSRLAIRAYGTSVKGGKQRRAV